MSEVLNAWIRNATRRFRSVRCTRKAMAYLYDAQGLQRAERLQEALAAARAGLVLLRDPVVLRGEPPEGTAVLTLTTMVEQVAGALGEPGAPIDDLRDSLAFLRALDGPDAPAAVQELRVTWLPYWEARIGGAVEGPRR